MAINWLEIRTLSYIAAIHWLEQVILIAPDSLIKAFVDAAQVLEEEVTNERKTEIACLQNAKEERLEHAEQQFKENYLAKRAELSEFSQKILPETSKAEYSAYRTQMGNLLDSLLQMNGDLFLENALRNPLRFPSQDQTQAAVIFALRQLQKRTEIDCKPNPFYAILLMDGDSLGSHMSAPDKQTKNSQALERFTRAVPDMYINTTAFCFTLEEMMCWPGCHWKMPLLAR